MCEPSLTDSEQTHPNQSMTASFVKLCLTNNIHYHLCWNLVLQGPFKHSQTRARQLLLSNNV